MSTNRAVAAPVAEIAQALADLNNGYNEHALRLARLILDQLADRIAAGITAIDKEMEGDPSSSGIGDVVVLLAAVAPLYSVRQTN